MFNKIPISLLIDDSCPLVHCLYHSPEVGRNERGEAINREGVPFAKVIPNNFLDDFCEIANKHKMAGKLSIVPMPEMQGDIINGINGYDPSLVLEWIETVKKRLSDRFDFSPEILTHSNALDLQTGKFIDLDEMTWSFTQDRSTLTPYIAKALQLLKAAGINANGVTSPWAFGIKVEQEYAAAITAAQKQVNNRSLSWYFLHCWDDKPESRPWIAYRDHDGVLVSIPSTVEDIVWETSDCTRTDDEYLCSLADRYISEDGTAGAIIRVLQAGGWPALCTHWQSLFSNGLETGLKVLDIVGARVNTYLCDRVVWKSSMEIASMVGEEAHC